MAFSEGMPDIAIRYKLEKLNLTRLALKRSLLFRFDGGAIDWRKVQALLFKMERYVVDCSVIAEDTRRMRENE